MKTVLTITIFILTALTAIASSASPLLQGPFYAVPDQSQKCTYIITILRSKQGDQVQVRHQKQIEDPYADKWTQNDSRSSDYDGVGHCTAGAIGSWERARAKYSACVLKDDAEEFLADSRFASTGPYASSGSQFRFAKSKVFDGYESLTTSEGQTTTCYYIDKIP